MFKPAISIYYQSEIAQTKMQHNHSLSSTGFLWKKNILNHVNKDTRDVSQFQIFSLIDYVFYLHLYLFIPIIQGALPGIFGVRSF